MPIMTADQWFANPVTGMRMRMPQLPDQLRGTGFVAEYSYAPWKGKTAFPPHLHPHTTETFEILSGTARCLIGNRETVLKQGDSIVMPPGVAHIHPWSDSDEVMVARQTAVCDPPDAAGLRAALQAAITIFGLANDGKVSANGRPDLLALAVLAYGTIPQTYLAGMPKGIQTVLTAGASVIGRLVGKQFAYAQYGVVTDAGIELPANYPLA